MFGEGRASPKETKIEENHLPELTFFESRNRLENEEVFGAKMTSKRTPKNDYGSFVSALGTSWEATGDPGLEIDVSGVDFGPYLSPRASKN